jgi:hypothetical protein
MGKNQSASNLTNIIKQDSDGSIAFMHGNTMLMQVSSSGAIATTGNVAGTASYASNAELFDGLDSTVFATTGSNTFTRAQYISNTSTPTNFTDTASLYTDGGMRISKDAYVSGTLYLNNLTVYGTQSVNYITSSQLDISDNIINLNTATPGVRFGGIAVFDSGSVNGLTGSFLWDSQNNKWIYSNPSGSTYDSGMAIFGPRNSSGLGNEQGTTNNALMKGQGGDHITSSAMFEVSGSVGVGITNPQSIFHIGASAPSNSGVKSYTGLANSYEGFLFDYYYNTAASNLRVFDIVALGASTTGIGGSDIRFLTVPQTTTGTPIERLRITNSGNVGIGTNSPDRPLVVSGDSIGLYGSTPALVFKNTASSDKRWDISISGTEFRINETGVAQRLCITTAGNIGIGIVPQGAASSKTLEIGSRGIIYDNNDNFLYGNNGWVDGSTWKYKQTGYACILATNSGKFTFSTAASGTQNNAITWSDKFTIENNGNVIVNTGQLSVTNGTLLLSGTPSDTIQNSGAPFIYLSGGGSSYTTIQQASSKMRWWQFNGSSWIKTFDIDYNGNATLTGTFTESSSIRYKTNIETIKYGLDKVLQLRGVTYDKKDTGIRELGLIAEEVNEILPDVVIKNEEGEPDSVSYGRLTAVLIEAVKDLQSQINELKAK